LEAKGAIPIEPSEAAFRHPFAILAISLGRAEVGLVNEHPNRWIALGQRIELFEQLHDRFRMRPTGELHETMPSSFESSRSMR
jgi:hypothetical protein